ncbi:MAG: outer membrane beta-barrel protein [Pseudomonadota bacterium]
MRLLIAITLFATLLTTALPVYAKPPKGFNTGPYLAIEAGVTQASFDTDQVDGTKVGRDFEPTFGFIFGWNLFDYFATELQGRYATNRNNDRRIHIAQANVYTKWFLVTDALTDFPTFRILPFLKGGMGVRASVLPGNTGSTDTSVTSIGWGPTFGAGVSFIWKKYFYFGVDVQEDLFLFDDIRQTVNGVPNTLVYKGGFHPCFGAMAILGVHY